MFIALPHIAQSACIDSSQHYEGHPKPHTYVITVLNRCGETRIVTVKIIDAVTLEEVKREEFPLADGETRAVIYRFEVEKLLSYAVDHRSE